MTPEEELDIYKHIIVKYTNYESKYPDYSWWEYICSNMVLSEEFVNTYEKYIHWSPIFSHRSFLYSYDFLLKYFHKTYDAPQGIIEKIKLSRAIPSDDILDEIIQIFNNFQLENLIVAIYNSPTYSSISDNNLYLSETYLQKILEKSSKTPTSNFSGNIIGIGSTGNIIASSGTSGQVYITSGSSTIPAYLTPTYGTSSGGQLSITSGQYLVQSSSGLAYTSSTTTNDKNIIVTVLYKQKLSNEFIKRNIDKLDIKDFLVNHIYTLEEKQQICQIFDNYKDLL
jgi:hypothetical protein